MAKPLSLSTKELAEKLGLSRTSLMNYMKSYGFRPKMERVTIHVERFVWTREDALKIVGCIKKKKVKNRILANAIREGLLPEDYAQKIKVRKN